MSLFKKFVGAFVEVSDEDKVAPLRTNSSQTNPQQPIPVTTYSYPPANNNGNGNNSTASLDDLNEARKAFQDTFVANNQPGNDLFEYMAMVKAMSSIPLESERYKVAFQGLAVGGMTKDVLLNTGKIYLDIFDKELKDFRIGYDQMYQTEVASKKTAIEDKSKQMVALSQQISQLNDEIKKMQDAVVSSEAALSGKKTAFEMAGQEMENSITNEIAKINQYII